MSAGYLFHDLSPAAVSPAQPTVVLSVPRLLARCVGITAVAGAVALVGGFVLLHALQEVAAR